MSERDRKQKRGGRAARTARMDPAPHVIQVVRVAPEVLVVQVGQVVQAARVIRVDVAAPIEAVADGRR